MTMESTSLAILDSLANKDEVTHEFLRLNRKLNTFTINFAMLLNEEAVENYSGVSINLHKYIPRLREGHWMELNFSVGGDAPKNFIALYSYERDSRIRKNKPQTWPRYIAKVGHKWYPLESINEYLFNRIGEVLNLNMAASKLVMANHQLRFLSKYFLNKKESLIHGAQIFAGYLEDESWVEEIERDGLARRFFSFQFAKQAIKHTFPNEAEQITIDFVKMLIFDAISGNNDRHFYNWGVVRHVENKKTPIFAPIYDSARGLFWNDAETKLLKWLTAPKELDAKIQKYAEGSKPKIGWDGVDDLNHFELINKLNASDWRYKNLCGELINRQNLEKVIHILRSEFAMFYSTERLLLLQKCITYRFERLIQITNL